MLKIVSANVNGIRAADKKGFFTWLTDLDADFVCVQELKAQEHDLSTTQKSPAHYHSFFHCAEKRGYSGVGIYTKHAPQNVVVGLGIDWIDREGRYLQLDYPNLSIISLYMPSGSSSEERQAAKFTFMDQFFPKLEALLASRQNIIICGDWNIAHQNIDLKNWKGNLKNSGFLPEERDWIGRVLASGWVDVWRQLYPEIPGYTWWSQRGRAYMNDVGWRIDYQMTTPQIAQTAVHADIFKAQKFSDHAPLVVDYEFVL